MLFTGTYRRSLDEKQRLPLPKPLRESLAAGARLYMTPGLDGCLAVFPEATFAALADRLAASSPAAREVRDYSRLFYSQAACVVPDRQWRVRVPVELAERLGLGGEVTLVGVRDHIEIWPAEKWQQYVAGCEPHYDQLAEAALDAPLTPRHESPAAAVEPGEALTTAPAQPR
jgi:MraZ protein